MLFLSLTAEAIEYTMAQYLAIQSFVEFIHLLGTAKLDFPDVELMDCCWAGNWATVCW